MISSTASVLNNTIFQSSSRRCFFCGGIYRISNSTHTSTIKFYVT